MLTSTTRRTSTTLLRGSSSTLASKSDILPSPLNASSNHHQLEQRRTLLGLVHAIDKRVYRWARGVLPPISKTENIALGCGTIGEWLWMMYLFFDGTFCVSVVLIELFIRYWLLIHSFTHHHSSHCRIRPRHLLRQPLPPTSNRHLPTLPHHRRTILPHQSGNHTLHTPQRSRCSHSKRLFKRGMGLHAGWKVFWHEDSERVGWIGV